MAKAVKRVTLSNSARKLPEGSKIISKADPKQTIEISVRIRAKHAAAVADDALMEQGRSRRVRAII